jgi:4-hydroxy-tetrahydrodipicolinate synthase
MTTTERIRGCGTALVTPFDRQERVDRDALIRLVDWQIAEGVHFLVACGTTGESVTLTAEEQEEVVRLTVETARGRVPVVAGAGGYDTREVAGRAQRMAELGVDAILSVTPYYNKPTQEGLVQHYRRIARSCPVPIILYNVPGRTGCNLEPSTAARLAKEPGIFAIKEASGSISQIAEVAALAGDSLAIFAGDDSLLVACAALGGRGVISVASNLVPRKMSALANACLEGDFASARGMNAALVPLFKVLFIESNPIPIKAALALAGRVEEVYRLPLVPMADANRAKLQAVLVDLQVARGTGA